MQDFDLEQQDLERRRALAQSLMQQGQQSPQGRMVGRTFIKSNPLEFLAQGLRQYSGSQQLEGLKGEQSTLLNAKKTAMSDALRKYGEAATGTQAVPEAYMDTETPQIAKPAVAPNMQSANAALMQSPFDHLQKFGMQGMLENVKENERIAAEQRKLQQSETLRKQQMQILQASQSPQAALAAGVPHEVVKSYYESKNYGAEKLHNVNGQMVGEFTGKPVGNIIPKQLDPTDQRRDLLVPDGKGGMTPNQQLIDVEMGLKKAGASNTKVSVNMPDKKFYEGIGTGVADSVNSAHTQAVAAVQSLHNANQIAEAMDKAILGPTANGRVALARVGQVLGVGGKDSVEQLANTRNMIQGLARQELAAASQMKGQGQITESERNILKRAEAGEIQDLSKPELQALVSSIRKTARSRIATHQGNMTRLGQDPEAKKMTDYMSVQAPDDFVQKQPNAMPQYDAEKERRYQEFKAKQGL